MLVMPRLVKSLMTKNLLLQERKPFINVLLLELSLFLSWVPIKDIKPLLIISIIVTMIPPLAIHYLQKLNKMPKSNIGNHALNIGKILVKISFVYLFPQLWLHLSYNLLCLQVLLCSLKKL